MARGKHAARAANRKAQLDSEIVMELKTEIETLKEERDVALLEKQAVERRIYSDAQLIGNRLSTESVDAMRKKLTDGENAATAEMRSVGEDLMEFCAKYSAFPSDTVEFGNLMARLHVKNFNEVFERAAKSSGFDPEWSRFQRRRRSKEAGLMREIRTQERGSSPEKDAVRHKLAKKLGGDDE